MKGKTKLAKEIAKKHGSRDLIVLLGGGGIIKNQETTMGVAESNGKNGVITLSVDSCVFDNLSKASKEIPIVHSKTAKAFSEENINSLSSVASKREIKNKEECFMLITGKEAKLAWANGEEIQLKKTDYFFWDSEINGYSCGVFNNSEFEFRLKPRTIMLNGIEVPAPFKPKHGEIFWHIYGGWSEGYMCEEFKESSDDLNFVQFGAWRTEEEIKQVVEALRSIFK